MFKAIRPETITLAVAAYIATVLNVPFWKLFIDRVAPRDVPDWLFIGAVGLALIMIANLVLLAVSRRPLLTAVLAVLLPAMAAGSYFMLQYGIVVDANMVRNVLQTDTGEAGDLMTWTLAAFVLGLGVLPVLAVWCVPWLERPFKVDFFAKLRAAALSLVIVAVSVGAFWGNILSVFRENPVLRLTLAPSNTISALAKYWRQNQKRPAVAVAGFGQDAERALESRARPHLFVVVVGETARGDHFGLNGYARATTPKLAAVPGLINYPNATSCGTDTAQSVPCMFSGFSRPEFTNAKAEARENLLDVLMRAKVDVLWRDNQAGCKGVCNRVPSEQLNGRGSGSENLQKFDEVLLDGLDSRIANLKRDTVIVLHMMGSHGPAYWKRYPPAFEAFKPTCKYSQFNHCSNDEIVNAYDNTILYTDHVLAELIAKLDAASKRGVDTGMLYVSDHGESLGEHNIYLHGMPYALAPKAQIHVPIVVWLSAGLREDNGIKAGCLEARRDEPVGHDNLFHSVLGIMDIQTTAYKPTLDLFAACTHHGRA